MSEQYVLKSECDDWERQWHLEVAARFSAEREALKFKTISEIWQIAAEGKDLRPINAIKAFHALTPEQKKLILAMSEAMLAVQNNGKDEK